MKSTRRRVLRINELVKRELGNIMAKGEDLPKDLFITITRVETSLDLKESKVFISIIPDERSEEALEILNKGIYGLQKKLNERLLIRPIPKIIFEIEERTEEADRIEKILKDIKKH